MSYEDGFCEPFCNECLFSFKESSGVRGKDNQLYCSKSCADEADFDLCRDNLNSEGLDNE